MIRRWLIRGFFILLLEASIVLWVCSYSCEFRVNYISKSTGLWNAAFLGGGRIGIIATEGWLGAPLMGWRFTYLAPERVWDAWDEMAEYRFLGFSYSTRKTLPTGGTSAPQWTIPCWFLTLLLVVPLWIAWRKTKVQPKGFPIEPTTEAKSPEPPSRKPPESREF